MRLVCISDTHNLHRHYGRDPFGSVPIGDVLIHAGDVTTHGTIEELVTFLQWFGDQPHPLKIFIGGNHDRCLALDPHAVKLVRDALAHNIIYLENEGFFYSTIKGRFIFWGSPYTPRHQDFVFQLNDETEALRCWAKIPAATNVLITHGPPAGILDQGAHAGCPLLLERVREVRPKVHVFGHDHEAYGVQQNGDTRFVNASVHSWLWKQTRPMPPHVIDL